MPIPTKPSISGFFRGDPELTYTKDNVTRLFAPVNIKQSVQDAEGEWHDLEPYKTGLVMFGQSAVRAHEQFRSGDNFIAEGRERTYTQTVDGRDIERDQCRASRIGHDNNLTTYTVDRSGPDRETPSRDATGRDTATREQAAVEAEPAPADPVAQVLAQRAEQVEPEPVAAGAPAVAAREAVAR